MQRSGKQRWAYFVVMAGIMGVYGVTIYRSTGRQYDPKPVGIASYTVRAGSQDCYQHILKATHGTTYGSTDIGQWLRLKKIAESCGGHVELEKNS